VKRREGTEAIAGRGGGVKEGKTYNTSTIRKRKREIEAEKKGEKIMGGEKLWLSNDTRRIKKRGEGEKPT